VTAQKLSLVCALCLRVHACVHVCVCGVYVCIPFTDCCHSHRFSASFSYYGLSLGADSLSDNLYVSCALMGAVELPGIVVCTQVVDRFVDITHNIL